MWWKIALVATRICLQAALRTHSLNLRAFGPGGGPILSDFRVSARALWGVFREVPLEGVNADVNIDVSIDVNIYVNTDVNIDVNIYVNIDVNIDVLYSFFWLNSTIPFYKTGFFW